MQPSLFESFTLPNIQPIKRITQDSGESLEERFNAFHAANPHVYAHLRTLALKLAREGKKAGIATIYEVLRYEGIWQTTGDTYKLNNDWRAFYSRMLMENEPELDGYFETRKQTAVNHS